jgi:hypothetical protein
LHVFGVSKAGCNLTRGCACGGAAQPVVRGAAIDALDRAVTGAIAAGARVPGGVPFELTVLLPVEALLHSPHEDARVGAVRILCHMLQVRLCPRPPHTTMHKLRTEMLGFGAGRQKMVLERETNPKRSRRVHVSTRYNRVEGNRRASRNGLVSDLPPENPHLDSQLFVSLYATSSAAGHCELMIQRTN